MSLRQKHAVVMAHFDQDGIVDGYACHYIKELLAICDDLIFVSAANIKAGDCERLEKLCTQVVVRENVGHDFMSYKVGLEYLDKSKYDEIIICNDSVYGPLFPLREMFEKNAGQEV